jgi:hypothetical protein
MLYLMLRTLFMLLGTRVMMLRVVHAAAHINHAAYYA